MRDLVDPADVDTWLGGRFAVVNLCDHRGPVETAPLAIADARHMGPNDFVATDLIYEDRVGEVYDVAPNPEQKWYYVPWLQPHEALLIKCYDSATDGAARFTAHTAFDDRARPPARCLGRKHRSPGAAPLLSRVKREPGDTVCVPRFMPPGRQTEHAPCARPSTGPASPKMWIGEEKA